MPYTQNGEDVVIDRAFEDQAAGFYVDVGAWIPIQEEADIQKTADISMISGDDGRLGVASARGGLIWAAH
jgi:hypothetical protein